MPHSTDNIDFSAVRDRLDISYQSENYKLEPFPLWALLVIYEKANMACYIDYMKGFELLFNWIAPIVHTPKQPSHYRHELLGSYETSRLSYILRIPEENIIECLITEVLPRLNRDNCDD